MLLLHISDIHFHHPICGTLMDPDRPFRTHLISDLRQRIATLGAVDAILVSGDIAFQGLPEEYEAALAWLGELGTACGCPIERLYVVPGNHDVDRRIITRNASVRNAQHMISTAQPDRREGELYAQLRDVDAGRALFAPIEAYNAFAARFNCQVFAPERPFWYQDLPLDTQTVLRLYGLTSTLLSGAGGLDDTRERLYLSPLQTVLDPVDGIVNLVMSHHPPDWFMDHDDVEDAVRSRATLQVFGHKHRQRLYKDDAYVRFSAGAVNPDRRETGWQPGYNLIALSTREAHGLRVLDVEAHLLGWQVMPPMFRPIAASATETAFRHTLPIRGPLRAAAAPIVQSASANAVAAVAPSGAVPPLDRLVGTEAPMTEHSPTRNLVFRFWSLAASQRRDIALRLGLIDESELRLPEPERYGRALLRAGERGLLDRVADEVTQLEKH